MPEDGFSSFEIQTPMENLAPCKPKGTPWILQILKSTAVVYTSKIDTPITYGGRGRSYACHTVKNSRWFKN